MTKITGYDHVGIRISDRKRAFAFYESLGFWFEEPEGKWTERAVNIINDDGVRINLICNALPPPEGKNVLMDVPDKWPGITHPAFIVERLQDILDWAEKHGVTITEGPVEWEDRRYVCFLRDPDGNVLEFNELLPK